VVMLLEGVLDVVHFRCDFHQLDVFQLVLKYSTSWPASLILYHLNSAASGSGRWSPLCTDTGWKSRFLW
jgi:hypothetical protein